MAKISIIMGIYNCAGTLEEAIDSILMQTYTDWEMIMCDDGSIDETYEVAEKYVKKYPGKFVLIRNQNNMGLNYTLNKCLELAEGDYIARMDGDDISLPTRFEKQVEILDKHPEFAIVSCPMILFDSSEEWGVTSLREKPQIEDLIKSANVHTHAASMIRRQAFIDVGGYTIDKRLIRVEDAHLWYKLYGAGYRGYNIQEPLYKMRNDHDAYRRRSFSSRMNGLYAKVIGYRIIKAPRICYYRIVIAIIKSTLLCIIPENIYSRLYHKKYSFHE